MDILTLLQSAPIFGPVLPYVPIVVALAAFVAAFLPPPSATGGAYAVLYAVINGLGQNYKHATNATAPAASPVASGVKAPVLLVIVASALLAACGSTKVTPATVAGAAQADVAALESSLTAAETIATVYVHLARCTGSNGPLCSDAAVVAEIKAYDSAAYADVKLAENAAGAAAAFSTASDALAALTSLVNGLPNAAPPPAAAQGVK